MPKGDICLSSFPFGGTIGAKVRPVLLLTDPIGSVPEILAAYMSSVIPSVLLPTDIVIDPTLPEHAGTNLKATSVLRLHKLATVHQSDIRRQLGQLSATTLAEVDVRLKLLLNL